jgi:hypothetical protein
MVTQFDWPDEVTLEVVEQFRQEYAYHYSLQECAMMLYDLTSNVGTSCHPSTGATAIPGPQPSEGDAVSHEKSLEVGGKCSFAGYPVDDVHEYNFVGHPERDFFCPVTYDVLLQPHLTSCCGNHLSQKAAIWTQEGGRACPLCATPHCTTVLNKHFRRQVNKLSVFCYHKKRGCQWVGALSSLKDHAPSHSMKSSAPVIKTPVYGEERSSKPTCTPYRLSAEENELQQQSRSEKNEKEMATAEETRWLEYQNMIQKIQSLAHDLEVRIHSCEFLLADVQKNHSQKDYTSQLQAASTYYISQRLIIIACGHLYNLAAASVMQLPDVSALPTVGCNTPLIVLYM